MLTRDYKTEITDAYLESKNLAEFLKKAELQLGFHLSVLDPNLNDPTITDPPEPDRWYGEVIPYKELMINNVVRGYLAVEKEAQLGENETAALDYICGFVQKMPEISANIKFREEAYVAGIYELLFSKDNERMVSLRAQIGLSDVNREDKKSRFVIINIKNRSSRDALQQLEYTLRHHYIENKDIIMRQNNTLILFKKVPESDLKTKKFAAQLEEILEKFDVVACISDYFSDPVKDFRMRQLFNCNEQVLRYLFDTYLNTGLIRKVNYYDDWRMVSLMYAALTCPGMSIYGDQLYISQKVKDIVEYDAKNATEYLSTLYAYLNCNYSLSETAGCLHIHRNTVVYRVKRMTQLFNIDFSNANECFRLNLSCRLHKIAQSFENKNEL